MLTLFHQTLCPHSRYVRLILGEYGIEARLLEERFWERREEFLQLNPAGEIPVLVTDGQPAVPGATIIAEYIEDTHPHGTGSLLPAAAGSRLPVPWGCVSSIYSAMIVAPGTAGWPSVTSTGISPAGLSCRNSSRRSQNRSSSRRASMPYSPRMRRT